MDPQHPLRPLCKSWLEKIEAAKEHKKVKFKDFADEAMQFFNGPHTFMWDESYMTGKRGFVSLDDGEGEEIAPSFRFTMNKVAEIVQLFGPALYHQNPVRTVTPRKLPMVPPEMFMPDQNQLMMMPPEQAMMMQMQAEQMYQQMMAEQMRLDAINTTKAVLVETVLNYGPNETNLKGHMRHAIDECLIKGMGVCWTERYTPHQGATAIIGSFYDTVDNLLLDPDVEDREDCAWCARECNHAYWEVEEEYGHPPGTIAKYLRGNDGTASTAARAADTANDDAEDAKDKSKTTDMLRYWKIYSRMGMGDRLLGIDEELKDTMREWGDNCFLVVARGIPFPLNLPSELLTSPPDPVDPLENVDPATGQPLPDPVEEWEAQMLQAVQWPIPFWMDGEFPFTEITFHDVPNCIWPMSHIMPGLGELRWLNWAMSFLATKVRTSCQTIIGVLKAAGEELKGQLVSGGDNKILELENIFGKSISDVVSFIQQPPFHGDIYKVIAAVAESFEKRVGLTELAYGMSASVYRSASEANIKQGNFSIRPDDMAGKVEDAATRMARKEAIACRWLLAQEDVAPMLGPVGTQLWGQLVQAEDPSLVVKELDYRIEAGSTRKPNKAQRVDQVQQSVQVWGPMLQQYAFATGDVRPINALLEDWGKAMDIDPTRYLLQPPPPPMMPPPGEGGEEQGGGPPPAA